MTTPTISIAIPLHNEEGNMESLYREIKEVMVHIGLTYEIVLVNDGSTDRTGEIVRRLKEEDSLLRGIELEGNFGEAAALSAGYYFSRGDWIITMDGDGQNDPQAISAIVQKLQGLAANLSFLCSKLAHLLGNRSKSPRYRVWTKGISGLAGEGGFYTSWVSPLFASPVWGEGRRGC